MYDTNGDGSISFEELDAMMRSLGRNLTEAQLLDMINEIDLDGNGTIEFDEFEILARKTLPGQTDIQPNDLQEIFQMFDKAGNGYITAKEIQDMASLMGEQISDEVVNEMIDVADVDRDGQINMDDFITLMSSNFMGWIQCSMLFGPPRQQ